MKEADEEVEAFVSSACAAHCGPASIGSPVSALSHSCGMSLRKSECAMMAARRPARRRREGSGNIESESAAAANGSSAGKLGCRDGTGEAWQKGDGVRAGEEAGDAKK